MCYLYVFSGVGLLPGGEVAVSVSTSRWRHNPKRILDRLLSPGHVEGWAGQIWAVTLMLALIHQDLGRSPCISFSSQWSLADGKGGLSHHEIGDFSFPSIL